ncbi:signal peptidase I [Desemzia sp. FAM 23989]|uniref:signal peptidase I n=1 Tax=Desemzia sp. FAM 23989 TaxID=3259523 RepID=UPI00388440A0
MNNNRDAEQGQMNQSYEPRRDKYPSKKRKTAPPENTPCNKWKEFFSTLLYIVVALVIFMLVRHFLFAAVSVEGDSMVPTLHDNDRLILNKVADINRFDIVVFDAPDDPGKQYIKRVIGVPGDTIEVRDDVLFVNGEEVPEEYLAAEYFTLDESDNFTDDFNLSILTGIEKVPEGQYFLLGDNRINSKDSRYFGFVEESAIVGTTDLRIWPLSDIGDMNPANE